MVCNEETVMWGYTVIPNYNAVDLCNVETVSASTNENIKGKQAGG